VVPVAGAPGAVSDGGGAGELAGGDAEHKAGRPGRRLPGRPGGRADGRHRRTLTSPATRAASGRGRRWPSRAAGGCLSGRDAGSGGRRRLGALAGLAGALVLSGLLAAMGIRWPDAGRLVVLGIGVGAVALAYRSEPDLALT